MALGNSGAPPQIRRDSAHNLGVINLVRLRSKGNSLVLNGQQLCRVMNGAISIVVIADRAIEKMITENAIKGFCLRCRSLCRFCGNGHSISDFGCARPNQSAILFHTCVTRLNRVELWVIADVGNRSACAVNQIDEKFVELCFLNDAVNIDFHQEVVLHATFRYKLSSRRPQNGAAVAATYSSRWNGKGIS